MSSTSAAAHAVAIGEVDIALTTEVAARIHNLDFVSPTRPIHMLWSVFASHIR
ncbi:Bacilysin biosynthesis protein bacA [Erwinia amylovora Ea266]|nr:Bacilysin biosynthesis protein bacA [Erwinia amylovora Ea266]